MTTFLYNIMLLTAGADKMLQTDPHGWTLTLISVSVVFVALIILYFLYTLSGNVFSGKVKLPSGQKKSSKTQDMDAVALAIALALDAETSSEETEAAIATALHLYMSDAVHDMEPGFITIRRNPASNWADKQFNFRKSTK